jgi:hypothetical protein
MMDWLYSAMESLATFAAILQCVIILGVILVALIS